MLNNPKEGKKGKQRNKILNKQKTNDKIVNLNLKMLIITLDINVLNTQIKKLKDLIKKNCQDELKQQDPTISCLHETHFKHDLGSLKKNEKRYTI